MRSVPARFLILFYSLVTVVPPSLAEDLPFAGPAFTSASGKPYPKFPEILVFISSPQTDLRQLRLADFKLKDYNGGQWPAIGIRSRVDAGVGMDVAVLLDVSGSMKGAPLNALRDGLAKFSRDAGPNDRIAIGTVADETVWETSWSDTSDQIQQSLQKLSARGTKTRLWDAVFEAQSKFPPGSGLRRIVVISDGHDEGSQHTLEEALSAAKQANAVVDSIGMTRSDPVYLANLDRLARTTGGRFRAAKSGADLEQLCSDGIGQLKSLPALTFRAEKMAADGKSHTLEVLWNHDGETAASKITVVVPILAAANQSQVIPRLFVPIVLTVFGTAAVLTALLYQRKRNRSKLGEIEMTDMLGIATPPFPKPPAVERPASFQPEPASDREAPAVFQDALPSTNPPPAVEAGVSPVRASSRTQFYLPYVEPAPGRPCAILLCEEGFSPGSSFGIEVSEFWIGSLDNNHLRITGDPTVSGNHACVVFDRDVIGIFDCHSTNGTRVNEERLGELRRLLFPGDRIQIGKSVFSVTQAATGKACS